MNTIVIEATLIGNKQYPSKLAAWKKVISDPRKLAFRQTTKDPTHMMTKIEVIIVLLSLSVRIDRVKQRSKHSTKGPHKSPKYSNHLQFLNYLWAVTLSDGSMAKRNLIQIFLMSLIFLKTFVLLQSKPVHLTPSLPSRATFTRQSKVNPLQFCEPFLTKISR